MIDTEWMNGLIEAGGSRDKRKLWNLTIKGRRYLMATNGHALTLVEGARDGLEDFPRAKHIQDFKLGRMKHKLEFAKLATWLEGIGPDKVPCDYCVDGVDTCEECGREGTCYWCDGSKLKDCSDRFDGEIEGIAFNRRLVRKFLGELKADRVVVRPARGELDGPAMIASESGDWVVFVMPMREHSHDGGPGPELLS